MFQGIVKSTENGYATINHIFPLFWLFWLLLLLLDIGWIINNINNYEYQ